MDKLINDLNEYNYYNILIKNGFSPNDIKKIIIDELEPYFENKDILEYYSINLLLPDFINYLKLKQNVEFFSNYMDLLDLFNQSKNKNSIETFKSFNKWNEEIANQTSLFWSMYNLQIEPNDLKLRDYVKYVFDMIDDLIEGNYKIYINNILNILYILDDKNVNIKKINSNTLGKNIKEIENMSKYRTANMFNVKLNTNKGDKILSYNRIRNIGAHKNYKVYKNNIICEIKNNGIIKDSFIINKEELNNLVINLLNNFRAIILSYSFFYIDNIDDIINIKKNKVNQSSLIIPEEAKLLNLFMGISSQGFNIISIKNYDNFAKLQIEDIKNDNSLERIIHSSQFLYNIWTVFKSEKIIVEYFDKKGYMLAKFEANGDICSKIYNGKLDFCELAKNMKIKYNQNIQQG